MGSELPVMRGRARLRCQATVSSSDAEALRRPASGSRSPAAGKPGLTRTARLRESRSTRPPPWSRSPSVSSSASLGRSSSSEWTWTRRNRRPCRQPRPEPSSRRSGHRLPDVSLVEAAVQHGREGENVQGFAARGGPGHPGRVGGRVTEGAEQPLPLPGDGWRPTALTLTLG